ncbi:MAG: glycosyltransferase family 2 protein [Candidatus Methylomirabilales bacterium]
MINRRVDTIPQVGAGVQHAFRKLSVVIPVYNERPTIEEVLKRVQAVDLEKEIIIIDDGSTDGTREFLKMLDHATNHKAAGIMLPQARSQLRTDNIRVFFQEGNRGKGAALRRGFQEVQGEVVLVQDADLEYDPQDYYRLLEPIEQGVADVVYGSRFLGEGYRAMFWWQYVGNRLSTSLSNMLTRSNLSDMWTCYKVFRKEVLQQLALREDRFGFEPEVTAKVAKGRWRVYEVPVSYHGRTYAEGKKITWKDGLAGIWCTLRDNLCS